MARRNKQDSDDLFIALLMSLPWWTPFILAILVYVLMSRSGLLGMVGAFFWAGIFVFAGLALPFIKQKNSELIAKATDLPAIRQMNWQQFEVLVGEAFRRQGYIVIERGGPTADGGIDLILRKRSETVVVQCKHWKMQQIGVSPVRELRGVVAREKATRGIFVTSGSYTSAALAEATGQPPLELIDGPKLLKLIQGVQIEKAEPQQKASDVPASVPAGLVNQAQATSKENEPLCPSCGSPMTKRLARRGANAGNEFWGCSTWPRCEGIRQVQ